MIENHQSLYALRGEAPLRNHKQAKSVAGCNGASDLRSVAEGSSIAAPKMADDKGPARGKVTKMTKISIKRSKGGLPQGKMMTEGRKDKDVMQNIQILTWKARAFNSRNLLLQLRVRTVGEREEN